MIVREKERIGTGLHNVARPPDNIAALEKSGDEVLEFLAAAHDDDLIAMAHGLIRRTVQCNQKCTLERIAWA